MALNIPELPPMVMRGDSLEDCIKKLRSIYGSDFRIIRREEKAPDGFFGLFKKKHYEVTYALLQPEPRKNPLVPAAFDFEKEKRKFLEANGGGNPQMKLILDELHELNRSLDEKTSALCPEEPAAIVRIRELLRKNEFTPSYIQKIVDKIRKDCSLEELDDFNFVQKAVVDWIGETIRTVKTEYLSYPQVIVLVGPTGVGKTTSVAKLAAKYAALTAKGSAGGKRVRIITIDTYRIGAKQQLETYGELMDIPVSLAESADDMQKLLTMYSKDVDIILVDTTGRSPKDYEGLAKMRNILDLKKLPTRVFLTVSASTKASDLRTVMQQYEIFGYESLIVTKMDETDCLGSIISIMDEKNKAAAYFTDGQRVPSDIVKATQVRMLIQLADFKIDREHIDRKFSPEGAE
ncbi:flagellar biosynthesis protein FlhF [Treponema sp. HNW]|uniref:flagellar biosynthesis protein FlhF n=1 Tax=Treponema sp. HNW TaxID=3116654 RepID=UPI003D13D772